VDVLGIFSLNERGQPARLGNPSEYRPENGYWVPVVAESGGRDDLNSVDTGSSLFTPFPPSHTCTSLNKPWSLVCGRLAAGHRRCCCSVSTLLSSWLSARKQT
jgi:hypothetical protein